MEEQTKPEADPEKEQSKVKKLLDGLSKLTHSKGFTQAQDETLVLLNKFVSSFKTALGAIDKFLESKGVQKAKLLERAEKLSAQAREKSASAKQKFTDLKGEVKQKGFKGFLKDSADSIKGKVQDKYKDFKEKAVGPPLTDEEVTGKLQAMLDKAKTKRGDNDKKSFWENSLEQAVADSKAKATKNKVDAFLKPGDTVQSESEEDKKPDSKEDKSDPSRLAQVLNKTVESLGRTVESLKQTVTDKLKKTAKGEQNERADAEKAEQKEQKESALVRFRNALKRTDDRTAARKKEIEEEKANAKTKKGGGKKKGFLGTIFGGIASAMMSGFGMITKVIGPLLGRLIGKSIMGVFTTIIPKLIPGLAGGLGSVVGGMAKGALKLALPMAWGGIKLTAGLAGKAVVGAAAAIGGTGLAVIVGAGLTVYGGYKLYKYLKRNDVSNDTGGKLTRLRLLTYGYNDVKKEHYHRLFELEMLMKEHAGFKNGRVVFNKMDNKTKDEILKLFEVTREEKEKVALFNDWYQKRFLPSYVAFLTALWNIRPDIYLDDLEKLSTHNLFNFGSTYKLPVDAIEFRTIPTFEQSETSVTRKEIDDMLTSLRMQVKEATKETDVDTKKIAADNKDKADREKEAAIQKDKAAKAAPPVDYRPSKDLANGQLPATDDTEPKPDAKSFTDTAGQMSTPSAPTPKMAAGQMEKGDKSLTGLSPLVSKEKIYSLEPNVFDMLTGMAKEYNNLTGKQIPVTDAFRTYQEQETMKRKYGAGAAQPGSSIHEYGMAVDIDSPFAAELDKMGLMRKYGFTRPIGDETWHIEPAGVAINPTSAKNDPADRLKRILASPGRGGGGLGITRNAAIKGKRDTELQKQLFMSGGETVTNEPAKTNEPPLEPTVPTAQDAAKGPTSAAPAGSPGVSQPVSQQRESETKPTVSGTVFPTEGDVKKKSIWSDPLYKNGEMYPEDKSTTINKTSEMAPMAMPGTDGANIKDLNSDPTKAVDKAATLVGINKDTLKAFAQIESNMRPGAANPASTAKGLMQFIDPTWKAMRAKYGPQYGIPRDAQQTDPYYSAVLGAAYAKENLKAMGNVQALGVREDTAMYLGHHYGPGGGKQLLAAYKQNPNTSMQSVVSPNVYAANAREIGNKTVGEYVNFLNGKIDKAGGRGGGQTQQGQPQSGVSQAQSPTQQGQSQSQPQQGQTPNHTVIGATTLPKPVESQTQPTPQYGQNRPTIRPQSPTPIEASSAVGDGSVSYAPPEQSAYPTTPQPQNRPSIQQNGGMFSPFPGQPKQQPVQPNAAFGSGNTDKLLGGMGDTLLAIKTVLEAIRDNGGMSGSQTPQQSAPEAPPPSQSASTKETQRPSPTGPIGQPSPRTISTKGVSMSRKPITA